MAIAIGDFSFSEPVVNVMHSVDYEGENCVIEMRGVFGDEQGVWVKLQLKSSGESWSGFSEIASMNDSPDDLMEAMKQIEHCFMAGFDLLKEERINHPQNWFMKMCQAAHFMTSDKPLNPYLNSRSFH